jgi:hypothetical protein
MVWRPAGPGPYLDDVDSELAEELERELSRHGCRQAADAVFELRLVEPCRCGDPVCASFYASGGWGLGWWWRRRLKSVTLRTDPFLRVELLGSRIVAVEVIDRPALRRALHVGDS